MRRDPKNLRDGHCDGLSPLEALDLASVHSFDDLLKAMSKTAFGGRQLGEAADVLYEMTRDPDCFVVGTFSGAMTVAKMGLVMCDMIDQGMLHAVVSTGALMAHGFIDSMGMTHFKHDDGMDDTQLYEGGYNRVYDTLELEKNLDDAESILRQVLSGVAEKTTLSSHLINGLLGEYLHKHVPGRGVLKSAYARKVPVYIPAFTDSEFGLDLGIFNRLRAQQGKPRVAYDPFLDLEHYTDLVFRQKRLGIFTIGGGVPRNWAQQVGPYLDIIDKRVGSGGKLARFHYAVRICPEPVHWGGLSGCTYSEGVSWGKFVPKEEGGRWAEVACDATIAWPILVKGVLERLEKKRRATAVARPAKPARRPAAAKR